MKKYNTKQKEYIINFIKENSYRHITATDIQENLIMNGKKASLSTIYRTLKELDIDNLIVKYESANENSSCYQYIGENFKNSYHFKCTSCSGLFHFECESVDNISNHIEHSHKFKVDNSKTMFYGTCDKCVLESGDNFGS